jgi:acetoin utilization protein AcuB
MKEEYLVRDFMIAPVTRLSREARLLDAVLLLRSTGFRHLPIVDGERLVGILTDRDVYRCSPSLLGTITAEEYNAVFEQTPIDRVMTRDPITVTPTTPLRDAAAILYERKLGCVPVVEDGRLIGIITVTDMLGVLRRLLAGATAPLAPVEGR